MPKARHLTRRDIPLYTLQGTFVRWLIHEPVRRRILSFSQACHALADILLAALNLYY